MKTSLRKVRIRNFKLFDEAGVEVNPGRITVFIGVNGTGKSSVLQALLLLKQSLGREELQLDGPILRLGALRDILHGQETERLLGIEIEVGFRDFAFDLSTAPPLPPKGQVSYQVALTDGRVVVNSVRVAGVDGTPLLSGEWKLGKGAAEPPQLQVDNDIVLRFLVSASLGFALRMGGMSDSAEVETKMAYASEHIPALLSTAADQLRRIYLVPPIRGFDRLTYPTLPALPADDLTAAGGPDDQARSALNFLAYEPDYADEVSEWLRRVLPAARPRRLRTRLAVGSTIVGEATEGNGSINLVNEAFGLNQLVSPLTWLARAPAGSVVGIEEPEIHLHPRAQVALAEIFVSAAQADDKQIVLITHSEHILMGLLTAVAEGRLAPDDLAVYEFHREGDAARAERLEVNEQGQIAGGLAGFLEVELDEIGSLLAARFPTVSA